MQASKPYATTFADVLHSIEGADWFAERFPTPEQIVAEWQELVEECENGYQWTAFELPNDLRLREIIDVLLSHPRLAIYDHEHEMFRQAVQAADERLKRAFIPDSLSDKSANTYWWWGGTCRKGSDTYADTVPEQYRHRVQVPDYLKGV